jgi:hypothetical protein
MQRKQLNTALNIILADEPETLPEVEEQIVDDYKKLGEKVDTVISKIKDRKKSRKKN